MRHSGHAQALKKTQESLGGRACAINVIGHSTQGRGSAPMSLVTRTASTYGRRWNRMAMDCRTSGVKARYDRARVLLAGALAGGLTTSRSAPASRGGTR